MRIDRISEDRSIKWEDRSYKRGSIDYEKKMCSPERALLVCLIGVVLKPDINILLVWYRSMCVRQTEDDYLQKEKRLGLLNKWLKRTNNLRCKVRSWSLLNNSPTAEIDSIQQHAFYSRQRVLYSKYLMNEKEFANFLTLK